MSDFLYEHSAADAATLAQRWLETKAEYGEEPDHDGSNGKGWRVFVTDTWGHVHGMYQAICAVEPVWAMYGK